MQLVLSLFTGVGLLDYAFKQAGFCVVSAGDLITGQDIRQFKSMANKFDGIIGGSPCQDFSALNRNKGIYSQEMISEYIRVVSESNPEWWLLENVAGVPDVKISGYNHQRIDINQGWYSDVSRLRHIQFGSKSGHYLDIPRGKMGQINHNCALAQDDRSFSELLYLQGLPPDYDLPSFNVQGKKKAIGNGVPLVIGSVLANAVLNVTNRGDLPVTTPGHKPVTNEKRCLCGCGRVAVGRKKYFDSTCRKRAERKRKKTEL